MVDIAAGKNNTFLLPDLGSAAAPPEESREKNWALSARQWGSLLSGDDVANTSVNYVKSVGASLVSEQMNHWLSQYGAARFSIDTDKNIAGDLLLPVIDNSSSLFFMQLGLRTNPDRNTTNLGLGYRQYWQNWMYGLNTFYDYDYKGNNARFGIGLEALTDYLKLATNGYFGLTDWHQSKLYTMHDEKPASGFDLRAEAYLPAYPPLGARVRYEKYFGKGIQLATQDAPDRLKDNPYSLTLGLSYTPIPLLTFRGDRIMGDHSETKMGLDVTYRFGVPLLQQLDRDAVDKIRYLGSNRYDFVDRHYDVVMQYSKRRALNISLPEKIVGKEAEIITVSAVINKGEDELEEIVWTPSSDFTRDGGKIRETSKISLEITLPHIKENSNSSREYYLNAVAIDKHGNQSNKATTVIEVAPRIADRASARIAAGDFTVITDNQLADGKAQNRLKVVVTDSEGYKVPDIAVAFSADNGANPASESITTNDAGEAVFNLTNTHAGSTAVTAKVGDKTAPQTVTFVADKGGARITEDNFIVITDNQPANGHNQNELKVVVTDGQGNKVPGVTVAFSADNGARPATTTVTTNDVGEALYGVTSTRAGKATITAKVGEQAAQQTVTFVVDKDSARIADGDFTVIIDKQLANGEAKNQLKAVVTDGQGNKVPGVTVAFSADNGANPASESITTNDAGEAVFNLTNTHAGSTAVTAKVGDKTAPQTVTFVADKGSARIADGDFTVIIDKQLANGEAKNQLKAVVTDGQGNKVPGVTVAFSADNGANPASESITTNDAGEAVFNLTNTHAGSTAVTAKVGDKTAPQTVTFVVDKDSARIADGDFTVIIDKQLANGEAKNQLKAVVTDGQGNKVPGVTVAFSADNGANPASESITTNDAGEAVFNLTNTHAGSTAVTAKVGDKTAPQTVTFVVDKDSARIADGDFTVIIDKQLANGEAKNQLKAVVTDGQGNKVPGVTVAFSADNGANPASESITTNDAGEAVFNLTNTHAGSTAVTAKVGDKTALQTVTFVADKGSARIADGDFTVIIDKQLANGEAKNQLKAVVTDSQGNKVPGVTVAFSADNGANPASESITTNDAGEAVFNLTNTHAGSTAVTAKVGDKTAPQTVTFVADKGSARVADGDFTVITDNQLADGQAQNQLKAVVTDSRGNTVPGMAVAFSADNGASPSTETVTTDDAGQVLFSVTNTQAGKTTVTAKVNDKTAQQTVTFTAHPSDFSAIVVSQFRFGVDEGFPKTGIKGAKMTLVLTSGDEASDFEWKSNQNWIEIDESSGDVKFIDTPTRDDVVITATAKNGEKIFEYKFKIDKVYDASHVAPWDDLKSYCPDGYPVASDISSEYRDVGKLWDEWAYYSTPYPGCGIWLDHKEGDKDYSVIDRSTGGVKHVSPKSQCRAVCLRK